MTRSRRAAAPAPLPAELYVGSANTWECDEMGHLNVRFYVSRATEGLGVLAARMGMPGAFRRDARATLLPLEQHIRFLKEVRPGQPLTMSGGVLSMSADGAAFYQELRHADGAPAAAFTTRVAHVEPGSLRPFPWAARTVAASAELSCTLPAHGAPRSVAVDQPAGAASLARAEALGLGAIGRGLVAAGECDAFGRMRPELFIGRVSDAVPNLMHGWRTRVAQAAADVDGRSREAGAAVLEYRLIYRQWPEAGDLIEVRSGIVAVEEKTHRLVHWVLDPVSGAAYATAEATAVTFDLRTRKTIATPDAERAVLAGQIIPDLTI